MSRLSWCLVYVSMLFFGPSMADVAVADVSEGGSYQTSVSIDVPEFHAIDPHIRLSVYSNLGYGPAGYGWALTATSYISRSSRRSGAPYFDDVKDQLWIDGMELMTCEQSPRSVSCWTGGTHSTRIESFRRITQNTATNSWTVWRQDGTRLLY